jgi:hypothetical protein
MGWPTGGVEGKDGQSTKEAEYDEGFNYGFL